MPIALAYNAQTGRADLVLGENGLEMDPTLYSYANGLLGTDARADESEVDPLAERRGFWAADFGTKRWTLARAKQTGRVLVAAADFDREALQPLIDAGLAGEVRVSSRWVEREGMISRIEIDKPDGGSEAIERVWKETAGAA